MCVPGADRRMLVRLTTLFPAVWAVRLSMTIFKRYAPNVTPGSRRRRAMRLRPDLRHADPDRQVSTLEGDDMDLIEEGDRSISRIIETTRTQLSKYRQAGVTDEDFVKKLHSEFVSMQKQMSSDAGSLHMALSCYRMAIMVDYIEELEEKVDFHKSAVEFLLELDEFETI